MVSLLSPFQSLQSMRYKALKFSQILFASYIIVVTLLYNPTCLVIPSDEEDAANGVIQTSSGLERPLVATDRVSFILLLISRISAFSLYPPMFLVFMSKCKATINFIMRTPWSLFMTDDQHELHSHCGKCIAYVVWIHTVCHLIRWGRQGNLDLLWNNRTGLSGLIIILTCPLITFPMFVPKLRTAMNYEIRKLVHYFFFVFAIGMCFHSASGAFPNGGFNQVILGFSIVYYTLDKLYVQLFMTEMIETTIFNVLPSGVQMTMAVSERFQASFAQGGYGYVCLPWVSKYQWHAFSLYEHPTDKNLRQVFMMKVPGGDWTCSVHEHLQRNTVRPVWISGPFVSPYKNALHFDNTICVASGIGITPALSVIKSHKQSRRINLVWACRDDAMLEFFMDHLYLENEMGWILIFYTGKKKLSSAVENHRNRNTILIKKRPNLHTLIPNIIYGIESGVGIPEIIHFSSKSVVKAKVAEKLIELENSCFSDNDIIEQLTNLAHRNGFLLSDLVSEHDVCRQSESEANREKIPSFEIIEKFHHQQVQQQQSLSPDTYRSTHPSYTRTSRYSKSCLKVIQYHPWEDNKDAANHVKSLSIEMVLSTWGMMYCGGSKAVEEDLRQISKEYNIALHSESFAW